MTTIQAIIIAAVPSILSGMTMLVVTHQQKKVEQRHAATEEREELTLEALNAVFCVTKELVDCTLYGKKPNGELADAYKYKQDVKHKIETYERKRASQ